jgi:hypothetical protein
MDQKKRPRDISGSQTPPVSAPERRHNAPNSHDDLIRDERGRIYHPFKTNFNDHFETPVDALRDLLPLVEELRCLLRPSCPENFSIYDPYFCAGTIRKHWTELGFPRFIHENRCFYQDIEDHKIPAYDMLITNPPYSDDHMQRLMEFLIASNKPWAMLVPDYTATKDWYVKLISGCFVPDPHTLATSIKVGTNYVAAPPRASILDAGKPSAAVGVEPVYVVSSAWYDFKHPQGVGHEKSHFKSFWIAWFGKRTSDVMRAALAKQVPNGPRFISGLEQLKRERLIRVEVRKNPQQRSRQQQQGRTRRY